MAVMDLSALAPKYEGELVWMLRTGENQLMVRSGGGMWADRQGIRILRRVDRPSGLVL